MKKLCSLASLLTLPFFSYSQEEEATTDGADSTAYYNHLIDSVEATFNYQTGTIQYDRIGATLQVPKGFHYLDEAQAKRVLTDLWGNPPSASETVIGMLLPEKIRVLDSDVWVFCIEYDEMGYVKDDDAEDIDYDELLAEMKKDQITANTERTQLGLSTAELIGWASKPYYDKQNHVLHWAKELHFSDNETNTLNYDIRVLGRKGVMVLNAVSDMDKLATVKQNIPVLLKSITYDEGLKYENFDSGTDKVAAWTVGGLVAGKVLAKVGFWAMILKFGKFIIAGIIALGAFAWKIMSGKKKKKTEEEVSTPSQPPLS